MNKNVKTNERWFLRIDGVDLVKNFTCRLIYTGCSRVCPKVMSPTFCNLDQHDKITVQAKMSVAIISSLL